MTSHLVALGTDEVNALTELLVEQKKNSVSFITVRDPVSRSLRIKSSYFYPDTGKCFQLFYDHHKSCSHGTYTYLGFNRDARNMEQTILGIS